MFGTEISTNGKQNIIWFINFSVFENYSFDFKVLEFQIWFMFIVSRNAKGKENVFDDRVIIGHRYKVGYKALSVLYMRI